MTYKNELRTKVASVMLAIGLFMLMFGVLTGSSWNGVVFTLGIVIFGMSAVMLTSLIIIEGTPWLMKIISGHVEPVWEGEFVYTDGGEFKIRYDFDHRSNPWFVASDVCIAVGSKSPKRGALKCDGIPLLLHGENACFSEQYVQDYLMQLAINNHAASRLLVNIRNNVLRKLNKQRDEKSRGGA